ncbi:thiol reductant ABC exporter subunit CydD [Microbacterium telephonicum]|uniref:ATP-binding cassette subfamily C protein CydD n=1 Tax=Microbacterium telephonicum TaxID=1714841 RepID=A0A498CBA5_9MICO|nr:thiol reductant ABC exporter subunit CydD [Microbacterium telephonicum]RLK52932.1 ATP-binding cassette subfamily C protein CydD [Microbacterium telephonicum]
MASTDPPPARRFSGPVDPRLLRYAAASRGFFVAIAGIGFLQTCVIVAFAWLVTQAVVTAIAGGDLMPIVLPLAGVVALRAALIWLRELVAARAAARVQGQLRAQLVAAVDRLGPGWLAGGNTAQLAVTAGRGLGALDAYFGRYLPQLAQTAIATPILVLVMWWMDWISGVTVLVTLPLIPLFMVLIGLATRTVQQKQWETLRHLAARFADTVRGLSTLKVFGRQHRAVASIQRVTDTYRRETMRVLRVSFLSGFALEFLASISVAIVAVTIGFRLIDGSLGLAVGLFVLLLAPEAYLPVRQVGVQFHAAAEGVAATDDVFAVLDAARTAPERRTAPAPASGELVVSGLRVHRGERVLPPVSFTAAPGEVVLVRGPSGAGKTSLLAALRGAADHDGSATYGGTPVATLDPSRWLAWAGQQPGLVSGTVADNVTMGDAEPDAALVARALDLAEADGIDAHRELGVLGAGLSGGQAQRVAVARAFYRHLRGLGPVIALDEPSAALDAETESTLWRSVRTLADGGAAVVLVSHRVSAAQIADRVVEIVPVEVTA